MMRTFPVAMVVILAGPLLAPVGVTEAADSVIDDSPIRMQLEVMSDRQLLDLQSVAKSPPAQPPLFSKRELVTRQLALNLLRSRGLDAVEVKDLLNMVSAGDCWNADSVLSGFLSPVYEDRAQPWEKAAIDEALELLPAMKISPISRLVAISSIATLRVETDAIEPVAAPYRAEDVVDTLASALDEDNEHVRRFAALLLRSVGRSAGREIPRLVRLLDEKIERERTLHYEDSSFRRVVIGEMLDTKEYLLQQLKEQRRLQYEEGEKDTIHGQTNGDE